MVGAATGTYPAVLPCLVPEGGLALRPLAVLSPPNNGRLFFLFGARVAGGGGGGGGGVRGRVQFGFVEGGCLEMVWSRNGPVVKRGPRGSGRWCATKALGR